MGYVSNVRPADRPRSLRRSEASASGLELACGRTSELIAAGDLLDLAVAELVAGDHGRQAVSVSPENVSLTLQF